MILLREQYAVVRLTESRGEKGYGLWAEHQQSESIAKRERGETG